MGCPFRHFLSDSASVPQYLLTADKPNSATAVAGSLECRTAKPDELAVPEQFWGGVNVGVVLTAFRETERSDLGRIQIRPKTHIPCFSHAPEIPEARFLNFAPTVLLDRQYVL